MKDSEQGYALLSSLPMPSSSTSSEREDELDASGQETSQTQTLERLTMLQVETVYARSCDV
jgi:hypothetical protein